MKDFPKNALTLKSSASFFLPSSTSANNKTVPPPISACNRTSYSADSPPPAPPPSSPPHPLRCLKQRCSISDFVASPSRPPLRRYRFINSLYIIQTSASFRYESSRCHQTAP